MNYKRNTSLLLFYPFSFCIFLFINIISFLNFNIAYLCLKFFILIFILLLIVHSYLKNGIISIYSLFISFCLFFLYFRIFFDLIGSKSLQEYNFGKHITWSENIIFIFLNYSFLYLITIDFFYYFFKPNKIKYIVPVNNKTTKKIIFFFFLLYAIIFSYKCYLDIKTIHSLGYTAVISKLRINYPFWTKGAGTFFNLFFYLLLMHELTKKETLTIIILYAIVSLLSGLKGARAAFFIPIIFILFYLTEKKYIKITISKLIILVFIAIGAIFLITISRGESLNQIKSFSDVLEYVFYNQTQTFNVPIFFLENKEFCQEQRIVPYIFSDILHTYSSFFPSGNGVIFRFTGLPSGMSLGESLFLELLDLPLFFALFTCMCISYAIKFVQVNFLRNRRFLPIFCCFVCSAFYMPRNTLFSFLDSSSLIYFVMANIILIILPSILLYFINFRSVKNHE